MEHKNTFKPLLIFFIVAAILAPWCNVMAQKTASEFMEAGIKNYKEKRQVLMF